jgi:hypothetical protein
MSNIRTMGGLSDRLLALFIVIGIVVSIFISQADSRSRDGEIRKMEIATCLRTTERAALSAAGWVALAEKEWDRGHWDAGDHYMALASGLIETIPAIPRWDDDPALVEVELRANGKGSALHLTKFAQQLHQSGCERVFPPI